MVWVGMMTTAIVDHPLARNLSLGRFETLSIDQKTVQFCLNMQ